MILGVVLIIGVIAGIILFIIWKRNKKIDTAYGLKKFKQERKR